MLGDVNGTENYLVDGFSFLSFFSFFSIKLSVNSPFLAQVAIVKYDL